MLTIRQEQVESFRQYHLQKFEDEMVEHLHKFSPQHCKVAGEPAVREVIRIGFGNAEKYGLTNRGPVRFYIELMFMFGSYFDTDPLYPWVATVFQNPERVHQDVLAEKLYSATKQYLTEVSGPGHQFLIEAMRRLSQVHIEDFLNSNQGLEDSILVRLRWVYPQRCEYLGAHTLNRMVQHGFKLADCYALTTDRGRILMTSFTFAMGHGFPKDPLCGWVRRRLEDPRWPTVTARVEELYSKAILYLSRNQTLAEPSGE